MDEVKKMPRCQWVGEDPVYIKYHDKEWGVPIHDDKLLFEYLTLESFQAGLSWLTVLKKRANFELAFAGFDPNQVAKFGVYHRDKLIKNEGIIRNRQKIDAVINNARAFLEVQYEFGSFDKYIWDFIDGKTIQNAWKTMSQVPTKSDISDKISKDLKQRDFKFVGSTIVYAHMQATGMVNDHTTDCFRYNKLKY
jgi:DNA-3-methyladenine glycosylase I